VERPAEPGVVTAEKPVLPLLDGLRGAEREPNAGALSAAVPPGEPDVGPGPVDVALERAKASGERVEVVELRSEVSSTFANPDGTLTDEIGAGPVWARQDDGWVPVDPTLVVAEDGSLRPAASTDEVRLSGGGEGEPLLSVTARDAKPLIDGATVVPGAPEGSSVAWSLPGGLPVPVVEETTARYARAADGADVVVSSRPTGPEMSVVVPSPEVARDAYVFDLVVEGLEVRQDETGGLVYTDATGVEVGYTTPAVLFDSSPSEGPVRGRYGAVDTELVRTGGGWSLVMRPDPKFLADPELVWPVVIDPSTSLLPTLDNQVVESVPTTNLDSSVSIGTGWNGLGLRTRSFLRFTTSSFTGRQVTSGVLSVVQEWSNAGSCATSTLWVEGSTGLSTGSTWNTQPTMDGTVWGSLATTGDTLSCPAQVNRKNIDITPLVQSWATAGTSPRTLAMRSDENPAANAAKGFVSADGAAGSRPTLAVTYLTRPNTPSGLSPTSGSVHTLTPTLKATASGGDAGMTLTTTFRVFDDTAAEVASGTSTSSAGTSSVRSWGVPAETLRAGRAYTWTARTCTLAGIFCSGTATGGAFTVSPTLGAGDHQYFTYAAYPISDRSGIKINVASGNLIVQNNDLVVSGTGPAYAATRTYNSMSEANGPLGHKWSGGYTSTERVVKQTDGSFVYYDERGSTSLITPNGTGGFNVPGDVDAEFVESSVYGLYLMRFHHDRGARKAGDQLVFVRGGAGDGLLWFKADRDGHANVITYNGSNEIDYIADTQSRPFDYSYTSGRVHDITDANLSRDVQYSYDANGDLEWFRDAEDHQTFYDYDANHNLTEIVGPGGNIIEFTYDAYDRVESINQINDGVDVITSFVYDDVKDTNNTYGSTVTDAAGHSTTYRFDNANRVTQVTDAEGGVTENEYDPNSNVKSVSVGANNTTTNTWDTNNNLQSSQAETGAKASFTYNGVNPSNPIAPYQSDEATSSRGDVTSFGYDNSGNSMSSTNSLATQNSSTVTRHGVNSVTCGAKQGQVCTSVDPRGKTTTFGYDAAGNLTTVTPPAGLGTTTMDHDAVSRVTWTEDGKGQESTFEYDMLDRIIEITFDDATTITFDYDPNGNVVERTDRDASVWTYDYDSINHLQGSYGPTETVEYTYDWAGNVETLTDASGTREFSYFDNNMVESVTNPNNETTEFTYVAGHPTWREKTIYPNGVEIRVGYDDAGRTTSIESFNTNPTPEVKLTSFAYTYTDNAHNNDPATGDTAKRKTVTTLTGTTTYDYDAAGRLTYALTDPTSGPDVLREWAYDGAGNILNTKMNSTTTATFTHNDANQLTSGGATYDANGNRTATTNYGYTAAIYNAANQTTSLTPNGGTATAMTYAGQTQDHLRSAGATQFTTAGSIGITTTTSPGATYTREPSGTLTDLRVGSNTYFYVYDGQGSVVGLTDNNGNLVNSYTYDPYGKRLAATETVTQPFQFQSGLTLTNGTTYKYGTRWYDTTTGTWTQLDPTGQNPGYTYVDGDPANRVDPSGRDWWNPFSWDWGGDCMNAGTVAAGAVITVVAIAAAPPSLGTSLALGGASITALGATAQAENACE
jgi:RHS repeat-associated protein